MIRAKLWFRCAAMHDPVTPMVAQPALVGWEAKNRRVDLTIERAFNGEELVRRMKGWVTTDPQQVIDVVNVFSAAQRMVHALGMALGLPEIGPDACRMGAERRICIRNRRVQRLGS